MRYLLAFVALSGLLFGVAFGTASTPNIILFLADDLGWNDVGWHNDHMPTPTMNKMAEEGVILNNHYVTPQCTPSRSTILSAMYPYHVGMQHFVILDQQPTGVPTEFTFLPELMQKGGYATHAIGKWHLGHCNWSYTPTYRGFDTHYGLLLGSAEPYDHTTSDATGTAYLDFRENTAKSSEGVGTYLTELLMARAVKIIEEADSDTPFFMYFAPTDVHDPMEVPDSYKDNCPSYMPTNRTLSCAKVSVLDYAMANITDALERMGLDDNTLIIFMADNGGHPFENYANNWPYRGLKGTLWEGGSKSATFAWGSSSILPSAPFTTDEFVHAADWFPTLLSFAGVDYTDYLDYDIDGVDVSSVLTSNASSPRTEFIINLDETWNGAAIRVGNYKLIVGNTGIDDYDGLFPEPLDYCSSDVEDNEYCVDGVVEDYEEDELSTDYAHLMPDAADMAASMEILRSDPTSCFSSATVHLYDISTDETESNNLATDSAYEDTVNSMCQTLSDYMQSAVATQFIDNDNPGVQITVGSTIYNISMNFVDSWPSMHNDVWGPSWC